MNKYLDISPEVKAALEAGKPVVALESTIISHALKGISLTVGDGELVSLIGAIRLRKDHHTSHARWL